MWKDIYTETHNISVETTVGAFANSLVKGFECSRMMVENLRETFNDSYAISKANI